jgi:phosphoesterase RecJ-like protein
MLRELVTVCRILEEGESFLVASHANPDGDAIGSVVALGHVLKKLGKPFTLYNATGLPERFHWVNLPGPFVSELPETMPQWTFILDCGTLPRVGAPLASRMDPEHTVNIDHHLGNPAFGAVNWIDVRQPSVGSMIAEAAMALKIQLSGPLAEAVYLSIATDTGFFTYGNTTPESLELVAELFRRGLDASAINDRIQNQWTTNRLRLWSDTMAGMTTHYGERVAVITVTREMMERTGTRKPDCEDLVEFVRKLKNVRAAAFLREEGDGFWKFSLRSSGADNVQAVAALFGGGGHKNAAGGSLDGSLAEARSTLVSALGRELGLG